MTELDKLHLMRVREEKLRGIWCEAVQVELSFAVAAV